MTHATARLWQTNPAATSIAGYSIEFGRMPGMVTFIALDVKVILNLTPPPGYILYTDSTNEVCTRVWDLHSYVR